ncbi:MAG: dUTP diphosphatase, partial [Actinomycetota bacterium]|nr:dUTP diphosphatase [Actinomycetota bacterium]
NTDARNPVTLAAGDRIAQLVLVAVSTPAVAERTELSASARGAHGFGSTGG